MENNFIQMAARASHAVAYTNWSNFKHIIVCVYIFTNIVLYEYCPLKRQLFLACRRNTYL